MVQCVGGPGDFASTLVVVASVDRPQLALTNTVVVLDEAHIDAIIHAVCVILSIFVSLRFVLVAKV